jgi:hypothetical protein
MQHRNLLGYMMRPAMMVVVTVAACAPRQPTENEERLPPSAMKEPSAIRPSLERLAQPRQKSYQRVKGSTKAKGGVLSVMGSEAKATGLLRICSNRIRHAISRTAPFRKSGRMGNCFGLSNTAVQAQGCNDSSLGCCRKRKSGGRGLCPNICAAQS